MKCPACTSTLSEFQAVNFKVDICKDGCSGIWFDAKEFEKCDEHSERFPQELLRVKKNASTVIDRNKQRPCPCCPSTTLTRVVLDKERGFEIDQCPKCSGHWLDIGELEKIRATNKEDIEIAARVATFEKKAAEDLKNPERARKVRAVLELIFK